MTVGDKVQSKKRFRLRNAIVAGVMPGGKVMVYHDVWQRKWIGERPQLGQQGETKRVLCRFVDMFDVDSLVLA